MYNPESVLENETHKLVWDYEIQPDHLISAREPAILADHKVKLNESEKKDIYLDLARKLKKKCGT